MTKEAKQRYELEGLFGTKIEVDMAMDAPYQPRIRIKVFGLRVWLTTHKARKLFVEGLKMCDFIDSIM
jgi:hypothetical protein